MTIPPDFPWRPGMLVGIRGRRRRFRIAGRRQTFMFLVNEELGVGTWELRADLRNPDLTDPATIGALAGAVREAWGDTNAYATWDGDQWHVHARINPDVAASFDGVGDGDTEAAAWLAAWNARPRSTP